MSDVPDNEGNETPTIDAEITGDTVNQTIEPEQAAEPEGPAGYEEAPAPEGLEDGAPGESAPEPLNAVEETKAEEPAVDETVLPSGDINQPVETPGDAPVEDVAADDQTLRVEETKSRVELSDSIEGKGTEEPTSDEATLPGDGVLQTGDAPGDVQTEGAVAADEKVNPPGDGETAPREGKVEAVADEDGIAKTSSNDAALPSEDVESVKAAEPTQDGAEPTSKSKSSTSKSGEITDNEGAGEAKRSSKSDSRRSSMRSDAQAATTAEILERLQKSYKQACKTLAVIGNIQRKESVLKLEEHQLELLKKFSKFEGHLEQLGLIRERSIQTAAQTCDCKSVPSEELRPPTPQEILPQVIICGGEEQVPKIIVCDSKKLHQKKTLAQLERERLLKTQKELLNKCEFMKEKLVFKETIIGNLQKQIFMLQKENYVLRTQLTMPNPTQQQCHCPGAQRNVCPSNCPPNCIANIPGTDSRKPSKDDSELSQHDSENSTRQVENTEIQTQPEQNLQATSTGTENVCPARCPHFKGNSPATNKPRPSKEESKLSYNEHENPEGNAQHVCPPTCPNYKTHVPAPNSPRPSKEESKLSHNYRKHSEATAQHVCPPTCPNYKTTVPAANSPRPSKEESILSHNYRRNSEGTAQHVCLPTCPYYKTNVPAANSPRPSKEESKLSHNERQNSTCHKNQPDCTARHVCPITCPYYKTNVPIVDSTRLSQEESTNQPIGTDTEVENIEVEVQEEKLDSYKKMLPCSCDVPGHVEGENGNESDTNKSSPKTHIIMRLCNNNTTKQPTFYELKNEYTCLKKDFNNRMTELEALRKDIVKQKEIAEQACVAQQKAEIEAKNVSDKLKSIEDKSLMLLVPKEQMMEIEQQIAVAKDRFLESQDELEDLRELTEQQSTQLGDYRTKYLKSHEQVEDQRGQIDMLDLENSRISENVALEIQHVKNQFEVRLQALAPLPDILKSTQEKLQELQQLQETNERKYEDMEKELQEAKDKVREYAKLLDDSITSSNMDIEGRGSMKKKFQKLETKYNTLRDENNELKKTITEMEEKAATNHIRLMEKLHEVAQLAATLEMLRVESARQVSRAKERLETVRQTLQSQILELEEQVAQSRAIARTARKDRDNIRQRMQAQIESLNESFEQAQKTIRCLQEQVGFFNDTKKYSETKIDDVVK